MKIMTRDGVDVTNAASRGSKTKEQRDHAHLMRIIKACDSCRAKKIRCDPSHKRRAASTTTSSATPAAPPPPSNSRQKRQRTVSKATQPAISLPQGIAVSSLAPIQDFNWDEFDASMSFTGMDNFDDFTKLHDPWSDFLFPEAVPELDYHNFLEIDDNISPMSSFTPATTSSGSSTKPHSPTNAFAYGELATPSHTVTNRIPLAVDDHDSWSQELGLASTADTNLQTQRSLVSEVVDDGVPRIDLSDGSGVPGDHGIDATLLSSTDTGHSRHRLEDPGTFANNASSPEPFDTTSGLQPSSPMEAMSVSSPSEAMDLQATLLGQSPVGIPAIATNATVNNPARALLRASPDSVALDAEPIATQTRSQPLAGIGGRGGILGLLPMSGPAVPGLAQLMLGGTSELIATSAPLSSRSLAVLLAAMAFMATSFVASVDKMFAHVRSEQVSLLRQKTPPRKEVVLSPSERCMPVAASRLAMAPMFVGVC